MSKVIITSQKLVDLADAVRTHNSISDKLKLPDIPGMVGVALAPGTYDENGVMLKSWDRLIDDGDIREFSDSEYGLCLGPRLFDGSSAKRTNDFTGVDNFVIRDGIQTIVNADESSLHGVANYAPDQMGLFCEFPGKKIHIPNSITYFWPYTFASATSLTDLKLPPNIESISAGLLSGCRGLTELIIPHGVKNIYREGISRCMSLTKIIIPNSVTSIAEYAFKMCVALSEIVIPDSVTSIGNRAFNRCDELTKIYYKGTAEGAPWGATNATVITDF